jgi:hypothetical protein
MGGYTTVSQEEADAGIAALNKAVEQGMEAVLFATLYGSLLVVRKENDALRAEAQVGRLALAAWETILWREIDKELICCPECGVMMDHMQPGKEPGYVVRHMSICKWGKFVAEVREGRRE